MIEYRIISVTSTGWKKETFYAPHSTRVPALCVLVSLVQSVPLEREYVQT